MKIIAGITITIGILMLIEGLFVSIWPKTIKKKIKNTGILRKAGILEITIAIILILIGLVLI